jgi:phosphatidylglycerol:prolipoprotein diacylglycerol transferase
MSYHGGIIGVIIMSVLFCRKRKFDFWKFADLISPAIPLGYTFGRIGNFINGELFGRVTAVPWGMYFPLDPTQSLRHPSQLYEAFFEGIFLFAVLWALREKKLFDGALLGFYIFGYGFIRFMIEFFREPDYMVGPISIGQFLCLLMMLGGIVLLGWLKKRQQK